MEDAGGVRHVAEGQCDGSGVVVRYDAEVASGREAHVFEVEDNVLTGGELGSAVEGGGALGAAIEEVARVWEYECELAGDAKYG